MSNQSEDPIRHEQLSIQDEHSRFSRRNMDLFRLEEHFVKDFVLSRLEFQRGEIGTFFKFLCQVVLILPMLHTQLHSVFEAGISHFVLSLSQKKKLDTSHGPVLSPCSSDSILD